jgi:dsDNA-binding SOS-regulon protein
MFRMTQSFRVAVSQSIIENVIYSNVRADRRNFMFNIEFATNNSQREQSIFIDIEEDLSFWMQNASDMLLKMIKKFKKENKNLVKKYNEQTNVIDEYLAEKRDYLKKKRILQNENRVIQNENVFLQNEFID